MSRTVQRITVSGYKSIEKVELDLGRITVLVGPNGAGKSNLIEAVELLGRVADQDLRLEVGLRGGAEAMLHDGAKGPAARMVLRVEAVDGGVRNAYEATLVPAAQGELIFESEVVEFHDSARSEEPWTEVIGQGHRESRLTAEAEKGRMDGRRGSAHAAYPARLPRLPLPGHHGQRPGEAGGLRFRLGGPASGRGQSRGLSAPAARGAHGGVPGHCAYGAVRRALLPRLRADRGHERARTASVEADGFGHGVSGRGPFRRYVAVHLPDHASSPAGAHAALLVLDEPELGLHPFAITVLAELLRSASSRSQVLAATQSVTLLDEFELGELVVAERADGSTRIRRPDPEESWRSGWTTTRSATCG